MELEIPDRSHEEVLLSPERASPAPKQPCRRDYNLTRLFEAQDVLDKRYKSAVEDALRMRQYLIERVTKYQSELEGCISERTAKVNQMVDLEFSYQKVLAIKENVSAIQKQIDELKDKIETQERRNTQRLTTNGITVSVYMGKVVIEAGTCQRLVESLFLNMEGGDVNAYSSVFLATYRSFTTSQELLRMIIKKYEECLKEGSRDESNSKRLRLRILNFLRAWAAQYYGDDADAEADRMYREFADQIVSVEPNGVALREMLIRAQPAADGSAAGDLKSTQQGVYTELPPAPLLPKVFPFALLDIAPLEVARQIAIRDYEMFSAIKCVEFLKQNWTKKDADRRAPNIKRLIAAFNHTGSWVSTCIVREPSRSKRAQIIEAFIQIASKSRKLNNFSAVASVVWALDCEAVVRLHRSWEKVSHKRKDRLMALRQLMSADRSFKTYRKTMQSVTAPVVPYIVPYLRDLTLIDEANPDFIENGLINFSKRSKIAEVLEEVRMFQQRGYNLQRLDEIQKFIAEDPFSEQQQMSLSVTNEPPEDH